MPILQITYKTDIIPDIEQILSVYSSSGINRPIIDCNRIKKMYDNANFIVTAWADDKLIGVARLLIFVIFAIYRTLLSAKSIRIKESVNK